MRVFKGPSHWPREASHWAGGRGAHSEGKEGTLGPSRPGANPCTSLLRWASGSQNTCWFHSESVESSGRRTRKEEEEEEDEKERSRIARSKDRCT